MQPSGALALLAVGAIVHLICAPYNKVEESFNTQAVHDILYHGLSVQAYDHLQFPGVVPRTFAGAGTVAVLTAPAAWLCHLLDLTKLPVLYCARAALGFVVLAFFANCLAYSSWLTRKQPGLTISAMALNAIVFRCDMLPLAGLMGLHMLLSRQITLPKALMWGVTASVASLLLTVSLDSIMWQRLLWPEGEVLWFNSVLNRSSEWGVQPFHWYWTSALPRAMLGGLPLACAGLWQERRLLGPVGVAVIYVCLYSWLPHKEVRFLFPLEHPWMYSKEEGLSAAQLQAKNFTFLLADQQSVPGYQLHGTAATIGLDFRLASS
ncbi:hypothetical protein WJX73_008235 [Symbiochloris irregularis]|uniref:Mannosyltransferase n=1 Tax=Symbiochloris irregularis TaxID=706552 RepID=A0AAW1NVJ5_9CHLO